MVLDLFTNGSENDTENKRNRDRNLAQIHGRVNNDSRMSGKSRTYIHNSETHVSHLQGGTRGDAGGPKASRTKILLQHTDSQKMRREPRRRHAAPKHKQAE